MNFDLVMFGEGVIASWDDNECDSETSRLGVERGAPWIPAPEPADIVDRIDELVNDQLANYSNRSGFDHNVNQDLCPHCDRGWHGLKITALMEQMRARGWYDEDYRYADDDSEVLCEGSEFIGPMKYGPRGATFTRGHGWQVIQCGCGCRYHVRTWDYPEVWDTHEGKQTKAALLKSSPPWKPTIDADLAVPELTSGDRKAPA